MSDATFPPYDEPPLPPADAAVLSERIGSLAESNLPLGPGLRALAEELREEEADDNVLSLLGFRFLRFVPFPGQRSRRRIYHSLTRIADRIDEGATIEEAVAAQGARVPSHLQGLVAVGARTGRLGQVLNRYAESMGVGADQNRRFLVSLVYPATAFVGSALVFAFILAYLINSFAAIYRDFGMPLPTLTVFLVGVARIFDASLTGVVELFVVLGVLVLLFLLLPRATRRGVLGSIPVVGVLWRNASLAEFCQLLALMLDAQMPLPDALECVGDGVDDSAVEGASRRLGRAVAGGTPLPLALAAEPAFPRGLPRLLGWAEKNQGLPDALRMVGRIYEARSAAQSRFAGTFLTVLAFLWIFFAVAVVVVGVFLPMITLIARLSG